MEPSNAPPIVCDYSFQSCPVHCPGICFDQCTDLLDSTTGKTRHHLQLILEYALKQNFEDVLILFGDSQTETAVDKVLKRKKYDRTLRITKLEINKFTVTQADALKLLANKYAAMLTKGFIYINGHGLPFANLSTFWTNFKKTMRVDSSAAISIMACEEGKSADGWMMIYDTVTGEVSAMTPVDRYSAVEIDSKRVCMSNPRALSISQNATVTTRLVPSFNVLIANMKLIEELNSNGDFTDIAAFCVDALGKPVKLNGIYLECANNKQTVAGRNIRTLSQLRALLKNDASAASDAIETEGNRSYWQWKDSVSVVGSVVHESVVIPATAKLLNCVMMKNSSVGENVVLENCVVASGVRVEVDAKKCFIGTTLLHSVVNSELEGPAVVLSKDRADVFWTRSSGQPEFLDRTEQDGIVTIRCSERWYSENLSDSPTVASFEKDPGEDPDAFLDELFDIQEAAADQDSDESDDASEGDEKAFEKEVLEMVWSVIDNQEHVNNLGLELRALRLSENRQDAAIMRPLATCVCSVAAEVGPDQFTNEAVDNKLQSSGLEKLIDLFCSDDLCRVVFYDAVIEYLQNQTVFDRHGQTTQNAFLNDPRFFVVVCSVFNDVLANEKYLTEYQATHRVHNKLLQAEIVRQYVEWLNEDDDDDSDDEDD
ncbi:hypothetical protein GNI_031630 [Gregarina niphandrodes]|uniref:W2 domain-containing protein n=1 Tax=Gregarina niphandrodes TaxID=110365 RepID=A0A023BAY7_GRENI|nr:hypothetical protein GNI_031630 [Gregarina niphandrodes]EZG78871.1 hypothetical protein GNI_031630 [Gregarina niphandrodes]|eukprot:XP_011129179.1 hypothetical protein GNI_031630 [Gregarina niphandrodes]